MDRDLRELRDREKSQFKFKQNFAAFWECAILGKFLNEGECMKRQKIGAIRTALGLSAALSVSSAQAAAPAADPPSDAPADAQLGDATRDNPTSADASAPGAGDAAPSANADGSLSIPHEKYTLANGLEVILHEDHASPFVAVSVWYHVGAFHEPVGRSGFAHLFEHLMFQGSEHVGDDMHIGLLEQAGASVRNGMVNGTTNFDRTNYFEVVPKNEIELALWLEADRMGYLGSAISQEKLDEQRKVVKNERLQSIENVPYGLAEEKLWQSMFPVTHPYYGAVIGSLADLDAATLDDVRAFYDQYYAPSNATLTIAGDFDPAKAKALVEKYFATLPVWDKAPARQVAPPEITSPIRVDAVETVGKLPKITFMWFTPKFFEHGDAEMDVLAHVLSSGKSSRLQRALMYDEQLAQRVVAYQRSMQNVSVFGIEVVVRDGVDPESVLIALEAQLEFLRDLPPETKEIERAVNAIETQRLFGLQKVGGFSGKAEQLQSYNHFLGKPDWLAEDVARYQNVTTISLEQAIQSYLSADKRAVQVAIPGEAPQPNPDAPVENTDSASPADSTSTPSEAPKADGADTKEQAEGSEA